MNKTVLIVIVSVIVIALGGFFLLGGSDEEPTDNASTETATQDDTPTDTQTVEEAPTQDNPVASVSGQNYLEYSQATFDSNADKNRVLFFHAKWCHFCVQFEEYIMGQTIPDDIVILEIDYDSSPDLKQQYGIWSQSFLTTVDATGNTLDSWHTTETPTLNDFVSRVRG